MSTARIPLKKRVNGEWLDFEEKLFKLVTDELRRQETLALFSRRLHITQRMLDTFDAEVAYLEETGEITA